MRDIGKQKLAGHESYLKNKEKVVSRHRQTRSKWRDIVNKIKEVPCMDCGIQYPPYVMEFDHREGEEKVNSIADLLRFGKWNSILEETTKCDIVCSNCHAIRTYTRIKFKYKRN